MRIALTALLTSLYLSATAQAIAVLGCTSTVAGLGTTLKAGAYASETACASACTSFLYAYYNQADQSCRCTNVAPALSALASATASASLGVLAAGCASTTLTPNYEALDLTVSDNVFLRICILASALGTTSTTGLVQGSGSTPSGCINSCKALRKPYSILAGDGSSCQCATTISSNAIAGLNILTCPASTTPNSVRIYEDATLIPAGTTALKKRDAYGKLNRRKYEAMKYCPGKLAACRIGNSLTGDGYECIDTTSELESCGGCIAGWAQAPLGQNETVGVDCSSLPGVAIGGVTCNGGVCEVSSCQRGWRRVGNACISQTAAYTQTVFNNKRLTRHMRHN